jgi:hypothetical protein
MVHRDVSISLYVWAVKWKIIWFLTTGKLEQIYSHVFRDVTSTIPVNIYVPRILNSHSTSLLSALISEYCLILKVKFRNLVYTKLLITYLSMFIPCITFIFTLLFRMVHWILYTRWDNCQVLTTHNLNVPNCNHRINQERYILPDDRYMLSETCRRNDDGPLVF